MPWTPWRRTSSATWKASTIEVCWSSTSSRRSLGTTIRVSTSAASSSMPLFGLGAAAVALEAERLGDDADGQRADLAGEAGDDRGGAGAGAAAGAGGDEDHVGALEQALDLVLLLEGGAVADLGVGAGAEPARLLVADVDGDVGDAELQRLKIGVDRHELDPGDAGVDHPVDRVDAGAADADDFDHRLVRLARAGRLVGGLLAAVARGLAGSPRASTARARLLGEDPFQALGGGLGATPAARRGSGSGGAASSARLAARRPRRGGGLARAGLRRRLPRAASEAGGLALLVEEGARVAAREPSVRPAPRRLRPSSPRPGPRGRTGRRGRDASGGSAGASSAVERKRSRERTLAHACPLVTPSHSPGPPSPAPGSSSRRCCSESYLSTLAPLRAPRRI